MINDSGGNPAEPGFYLGFGSDFSGDVLSEVFGVNVLHGVI